MIDVRLRNKNEQSLLNNRSCVSMLRQTLFDQKYIQQAVLYVVVNFCFITFIVTLLRTLRRDHWNLRVQNFIFSRKTHIQTKFMKFNSYASKEICRVICKSIECFLTGLQRDICQTFWETMQYHRLSGIVLKPREMC